jgi:hypothetical protein
MGAKLVKNIGIVVRLVSILLFLVFGVLRIVLRLISVRTPSSKALACLMKESSTIYETNGLGSIPSGRVSTISLNLMIQEIIGKLQ